MKRVFSAVAALALCLAIGHTAAEARGPMGGGFGGGCGNCSSSQNVNRDLFKKFQAETIDLRQEMMTKRFEMQRENLKAAPDQAKLAQLKKEIEDIQLKIQAVRVQNGLPERGGMRDGECNPGNCLPGRVDCGSSPCGQRF